jgi:DNA-binding CsgD family transcriptional regulator
MDVRENREKLEKLATLTSAQVQVMYYRCLDKTVSEITNILDLDNEGTVWARFTQIFKKLGVSGQEELVLQYSPIFLKYVKSEEDWKNWGHIRAAMLDEAHTLSSQAINAVESSLPSEVESSRTEGGSEETVTNSATSNLSAQTPRSQQNDTEKTVQVSPERRIAWPLIAIPLVILGLLCMAGIAFGIPFLGNIISPDTTPTSAAATQTSVPLIQATSTREPSPTVQLTDTAILLPTETLTPTATRTPTSTLTLMPTITKSPIGLVKGDELQDNRVTLKLTDIQYNQKYDRIGAKVAPISFFFDFTNHSGETIVLQFDSSDFQSIDNTGYEADCWFYHISGAGEKVNEPLNNGDTREIVARCGLGNLNPNVTTVTLTIHPFSSLPESTWIAEVPH